MAVHRQEAQRGVAQQGAGQDAGLGEDLEAVAHAEQVAAARDMLAHRGHHRRMRRHRAAAQIVAVGEAAGDHDQVEAGEVGLLVPDHARRGARAGQRDRHVALAVDAGEDDDAGFHGRRSATTPTRSRKMACRAPRRSRQRRGQGSGPAGGGDERYRIHRHPETLDHRVRQQLPRHLLGGGTGALGVGLRQLQLDHLACAHLADIGEAQSVQRVADRLALRVQHARLQHHRHGRLHCISSGPFMSRTPASGRMPRRLATSW